MTLCSVEKFKRAWKSFEPLPAFKLQRGKLNRNEGKRTKQENEEAQTDELRQQQATSI
jgi:hypothetical protein